MPHFNACRLHALNSSPRPQLLASCYQLHPKAPSVRRPAILQCWREGTLSGVSRDVRNSRRWTTHRRRPPGSLQMVRYDFQSWLFYFFFLSPIRMPRLIKNRAAPPSDDGWIANGIEGFAFFWTEGSVARARVEQGAQNLICIWHHWLMAPLPPTLVPSPHRLISIKRQGALD